MTFVALLEDNAGNVYAFRDDDHRVWNFGQVTPDMFGKFADDALAWINGTWEPCEADGQTEAGPDCTGLDHVADYAPGALRVIKGRDTHPIAHLYISGEKAAKGAGNDD